MLRILDRLLLWMPMPIMAAVAGSAAVYYWRKFEPDPEPGQQYVVLSRAVEGCERESCARDAVSCNRFELLVAEQASMRQLHPGKFVVCRPWLAVVWYDLEAVMVLLSFGVEGVGALQEPFGDVRCRGHDKRGSCCVV